LTRGESHILGIITSLKSMVDSDIPQAERSLGRDLIKSFEEGLEHQKELLACLQRYLRINILCFSTPDDWYISELASFRRLANARIQYFAHLQRLSDSVSPLETPANKRETESQLNILQTKLASQIGRVRYLTQLFESKSDENGSKECVICRSLFVEGMLLDCGHVFCTFCFMSWVKVHKKCALCNASTHGTEPSRITTRQRPQNNQTAQSNEASTSTTLKRPMSAFSNISRLSSTVMVEIESTKSDGSFGTKLDFIIKHLLYLSKQSLAKCEVPCKSIIVSQWDQVLDILSIGMLKIRNYVCWIYNRDIKDSLKII
jgi:hypothetical protein